MVRLSETARSMVMEMVKAKVRVTGMVSAEV
jgi:hypothetical protein